jgi:hypothetical protein
MPALKGLKAGDRVIATATGAKGTFIGDRDGNTYHVYFEAHAGFPARAIWVTPSQVQRVASED